MASVPVCAVATSSPRAVSPMRSALTNAGSSSTTRTFVMRRRRDSRMLRHARRRRHGEDHARAPRSSGVDPDGAAVRLDEGLGDGQAESRSAPPLFWLNISKTRSLSSAAMPGPSSATEISTNGTAGLADRPGADADGAVRRATGAPHSPAGWPAPARSARDRSPTRAGRPAASSSTRLRRDQAVDGGECLVHQLVEGNQRWTARRALPTRSVSCRAGW